jgi:hypothetical protein
MYCLQTRKHIFSQTLQSQLGGMPVDLVTYICNIYHDLEQSFEKESISKNSVFWDVTSCGSYKKRRFEGTYRLQQGDKNRRDRNNVGSN